MAGLGDFGEIEIGSATIGGYPKLVFRMTTVTDVPAGATIEVYVNPQETLANILQAMSDMRLAAEL